MLIFLAAVFAATRSHAIEAPGGAQVVEREIRGIDGAVSSAGRATVGRERLPTSSADVDRFAREMRLRPGQVHFSESANTTAIARESAEGAVVEVLPRDRSSPGLSVIS